MSHTEPPDRYDNLSLPEVLLAHHPASSATVTPVIVVSLHRPFARHAFTRTMADSLVTTFGLLSADPRVRAVVLTSSDPENKDFCIGLDLHAVHSLVGTASEHRDPGGRVALAIYNCVKPVIAAINGTAVGIGITMTLPADIRVVSNTAKIGFVFGRRAFALEACSSFFLPRLIGTSRASHLVTTGAVYPATHRLLDSLFGEIVPPEEVLPTALRIAEEVVGNVSIVATRVSKDLMYRGGRSPEEAHLLESRLFHPMVLSEDAREGQVSFFEKRRPTFKTTTEEAPSAWPWWTPVDVRAKAKL